jgi:hypothetical protein
LLVSVLTCVADLIGKRRVFLTLPAVRGVTLARSRILLLTQLQELRIMKKLLAGVVLAGTLALQSVAFAGASFPVPVTIGTNIAYGALKTARTSANASEHIGCAVYGTTYAGNAPTYVSCSAASASGQYFSCSTYGPAAQMVQAALAISAGSYVIIQSDASYNCVYIYVNNNSGYT